MKKILMLLVCIMVLCGCSSNVSIDKLNMSDYILDDFRYSILDVDDYYIYINVYNGDNTDKVVVVDHDGNAVKEYSVEDDLKILDFIIDNDCIYYFTMSYEYNYYVCHLYKEDSNGKELLNEWILSDYYNYPTFISTSESIYYRVDNKLYVLGIKDPVLEEDIVWLFALEEPHKKSIGFKVLNEEGLYDVYESSNEDVPVFSNKNVGKFYVDDDYIIFESRDNYYLYAYNKETKKITCIADKAIDNFEVSHSYIAVNIGEEIIIYDKNGFDEIEVVDKNKYSINALEYIYKLNDDFYMVSTDKNIIRIKVK